MVLDILPPWLATSLPILSLLFIGFVVEKHYVSRVTCFTNATAVYIYAIQVESPGFWMEIYTVLGLLIGFYGLLTYWAKISAQFPYYALSYFLYSSFVVFLITIVGISWLLAIVVGIVTHFLLLFVPDLGTLLVYTKSRPVQVQEFIQSEAFEFKNIYGRWQTVKLSDIFD